MFSTTGTSAGATVIDRLIIDSSGLATFGSSLTLASSSSTLTSSGNTVLGSGSTSALTVNAAAQFNAAATFNAAVIYGGAVTVVGLLTASGNTVLGAGSSNTLTVNAAATFNAGMQIFGSSGSAITAPTVSFLRQYPSAAAAPTNAVVGSAVYSRWDGSAYNPTAQIRSVYTVCSA